MRSLYVLQLLAFQMSSSPGQQTVILIVDDEVIVRNIVQRILTQAGFAVLAAADGLEALELFETFPDTIDVLLTDIDMPRLDGFQLAKRIRLDKPNVKIVFMSGKLDTVTGTMLEHFVSKPFGPTALVDAVRKALAGSPSQTGSS